MQKQKLAMHKRNLLMYAVAIYHYYGIYYLLCLNQLLKIGILIYSLYTLCNNKGYSCVIKTLIIVQIFFNLKHDSF